MDGSRVDKPDYLLQLLVVWLAMLGISSYDFQPFLVGGFVAELGLSDAQAGLVMAANMLGVCVALVITTFGLQTWPRSRLVLAALLVMSLGNLSSVFVPSTEGLIAVRFAVGLGEGLAMAAAVSAVATFANPDRLFAFVMVGMSLYGMVGLLVLPALIETYGLAGVFGTVAAICLLTIPLHRSLPHSEAAPNKNVAGPSLRMDTSTVLLLLSLLILYVSTNGVWTYYERIGTAMEFTASIIGIALSAGLGASMLGGLAAAALNDRLGRFVPTLAGVGMAGLGVLILSFGQSFVPYLISVMLLFGGTGFAVPYFMGQLTQLDPSGRLAVIGFLTLSLGNFVGPAVAAAVVGPGGYHRLILLGAAVIGLSLLLVIAAFKIVGSGNTELIQEV